jgi:uncharacterized protein with FMN-binding domain
MKQRIGSGLVTLSSAAILSVYAAGYARTRDASDRFDAEDQRRPPSPLPAVAPEAATSAPTDGPAFALPTRPASELQRPAVAPGPEVTDVRSAASTSSTPTASQAITTQATRAASSPDAALAIANTAAASVAANAQPQPAAAAAPVAAVAPTEAPAAAPTPAAPAAIVLKDGTYLGWGHCRHGDIQAAVTIDAGKITEARIATCLTRYSCSWISPLPPQVIQRQSPETDYVSGATDSTNAFYYAVIDALTKAK